MEYRENNFRWFATLILLSMIFFTFAGLPATLTDPIAHTTTSIIFYWITCFAQNFLFACVLGIVLIPIFLWIRSTRMKVILSFPILFFTFFMFFVNAKVFSFWRIFISGDLLSMYFAAHSSEVVDLDNKFYVWMTLAIIIFVLLTVLTLWLSHRLRNIFPRKLFFGAGLLVYVIAQVGFIMFAREDNMSVLQYTTKVPYFYNFSWARVLHHFGKPISSGHTVAAELRHRLADAAPLQYPLHPLQFHVPAKPLNVLLIVVDTLRFDMLNIVNMPHVFKFSEHADRFLDNLSGGDCTRPGIFSLMYGIPANYWQNAKTYRTESIIVKSFQENHYHIEALGSAPLTWPAFDDTVFADVKNLQILTPGKTPMDRDAEITREMQQFLIHSAHDKKPFFGFMFYDAPHAYNALPLTTPFSPVEPLNYFDINRHTNRTKFFNLYQNAVFYDDHLISKIFATLKENHLMQNTVVVITSDHGQEFNDNHNNYWEHASGFSKYQVRTPMVIAWPNRTPKIYHDQTTHFDLAPTLLKGVLGVTNPTSDYSVGDDFFNTSKQPKFVLVGNYAYYALITHQHILEFHHSGIYRMTDLNMNAVQGVAYNKKDADNMLVLMKKYM